MKKFISIILALAMVLTMSVPVFADDTAADESAPAQLTAAQVKAINDVYMRQTLDTLIKSSSGIE